MFSWFALRFAKSEPEANLSTSSHNLNPLREYVTQSTTVYCIRSFLARRKAQVDTQRTLLRSTIHFRPLRQSAGLLCPKAKLC